MEYVSSKNSYEHWSEQWEENVAGLLAYQNTVHNEIDECLQDGDLIGAAAASFDQALAAWEIGDIKEAQAYIWIGQMLGHADIVLQREVMVDEPVPVSFEVPELPVVWSKDEKRWVDDLSQPLQNAVIEAESVLALDPEIVDIDSSEKNAVLLSAINKACDIILTDQISEQHPSSQAVNLRLLNLARELAEWLDINVDEESTSIAYRAVSDLADAAIYARGATLRSLNLAQRLFAQIEDGTTDYKLGQQCIKDQNIISWVKKARAHSLFASRLQNTYEVFRPYLNGGASRPHYETAQASSAMRDTAKLRYALRSVVAVYSKTP